MADLGRVFLYVCLGTLALQVAWWWFLWSTQACAEKLLRRNPAASIDSPAKRTVWPLSKMLRAYELVWDVPRGAREGAAEDGTFYLPLLQGAGIDALNLSADISAGRTNTLILDGEVLSLDQAEHRENSKHETEVWVRARLAPASAAFLAIPLGARGGDGSSRLPARYLGPATGRAVAVALAWGYAAPAPTR